MRSGKIFQPKFLSSYQKEIKLANTDGILHPLGHLLSINSGRFLPPIGPLRAILIRINRLFLIVNGYFLKTSATTFWLLLFTTFWVKRSCSKFGYSWEVDWIFTFIMLSYSPFASWSPISHHCSFQIQPYTQHQFFLMTTNLIL